MSISASSVQRIPSSSPAASTRASASPAQLDEALRALDATARALAAQLRPRVDVDDLKGHAHEALLDLLDRFDPERGVPFAKYARPRLRGAMLDGLRKQSGLPRGFAARVSSLRAGDLFVDAHRAQGGASTDSTARDADAELASLLRGVATASALGWACVRDAYDVDESGEIAAPTIDDPECQVERAQARRALERALAGLEEKEAWLVRRHYFDGVDKQDAAAELGLSKSWGSRLLARGVAQLAERLREMRFDWR